MRDIDDRRCACLHWQETYTFPSERAQYWRRRPGRDMHVGLIGTGRIGALHARSLRGSPLVSKLTIFDSDSKRAAKVAGEVSASQAESPQALLADGVDAIV